MNTEHIVDKQLKAYNEKNVESFLDCYTENTVGFHLDSEKVLFETKDDMRKLYTNLFTNKELFCTVENRIAVGQMITDHERIKRDESGEFVEAIAIYHVNQDGLIDKVWFSNGGKY